VAAADHKGYSPTGIIAALYQHEFLGYGPQKQMALEHTTHRWVLLLDADEALSPEGQARVRDLLAAGPAADGYRLPRHEQMFWQLPDPRARMNYFLRLFDKTRGHVSDMPIHAAPEVDGRVEKLDAPFIHHGEPDIHTKVAKINGYSTGLVADKQDHLSAGGMTSKLESAQIAAHNGIPVVIANGRKTGALTRIFQGLNEGTLLFPKESNISKRKRWIAFFNRAEGHLVIDDGAAAALHKGKSLLPVGIKLLSTTRSRATEERWRIEFDERDVVRSVSHSDEARP